MKQGLFRFSIYFFIFALLFAVLGTGCGDLPQKTAVARVNGEIIDEKDLQEFLNLIYLYMPDFEERYTGKEAQDFLKNEILWFLIENRILQQEVNSLGLSVDEEKVEKDFEQSREELISMVYGSREKFNKRLKELGLEETSIKLIFRDAHLRELLFEHVGAGVTEEEARNFVEENPSFLSRPSYVYAYHILLESEEEAREVLKVLEEGADFVETGEKYSLDNFVELGRISSEDMFDPVFLAAAFSLEPGEISEPVQTSFGYHIIKITEKEEARELTFEEVKEEALEMKKHLNFEEYLQKLVSQAEVETFLE